MMQTVLPGAAFKFGSLVSAAVLLAGCSMGGNMFGGGTSNTQLQNASQSQAEIAAAAPNALPAIATECPPIKVRTGGETLFSYGRGRVGNPRDLNYQAVIEEQSRNCVVSNGRITVNMGVRGRVLLGPAGNQTSANLPIRFAVESDGVAVFSEKYEKSVAIDPALQAGSFEQVVSNVAIPYVGGESITIWVGFDTRG